MRWLSCFCRFTFELQSSDTSDVLASHICRILTSRGYRCVLAQKQADNTLYFQPVSEDFFVHNSFRPQISIRLYEKDSSTLISGICQLKRSTLLFMLFYILFAAIFEIVLLSFFFSNQLAVPVLLCLPLLLIFSAVSLSGIGLRISSANIQKALEDEGTSLHLE